MGTSQVRYHRATIGTPVSSSCKDVLSADGAVAAGKLELGENHVLRKQESKKAFTLEGRSFVEAACSTK